MANKTITLFLFLIGLTILSGFSSAVTCTSSITACCSITSSGTYTLTSNFAATGDCISITASNILLDGAGFGVTGNASGSGIASSNASNITIKNFASLTNFSNGIITSGVNDSLIANNNISYGVTSAITLSTNSYRDIVSNNILSNSSSGIGISLSGIVANSNITGNRISGFGGRGISLAASASNYISGNYLLNNSYGIYLQTTGVNNNQLVNNIFQNNSNGIMLSLLVHDNNITNSIIYGSSVSDLVTSSSAGTGNYIIDSSIGSYSFPGNGLILYFKDANEGEIRFLSKINGTGTNLSADIQIGSDFVYVNSGQIGLNRSANITLYSIPSFTNATIFRDGVPCPSGICTNYTSLTGNVILGVTGWSNYTIGSGGGGSLPGVPEFSTIAIIAAITLAIASVFFIRSRNS